MNMEASHVKRHFLGEGWRKWVVRIILVFAAPALVLGLLEAGLRSAGYGHRTAYWIGGIEPGTRLSNPQFGVRFFGRELNRPTVPAVVTARKPPGTYRIIVFGSSAAYGTPNPTFSFGRILETMLNDRFPGTRFEVVNTALTAANSHVVLPTMRDCRGLDGDLYIIYMGHNEVIGPYGAATVFARYSPSLGVIRASIWLRSTRTGQLVGDAARALGGGAPSREWMGMKMFLAHKVARDDPRLKNTYRNFEVNMRAMCAEARRAGAKVLLATVLTNLKDCPPFASEHRAGLPPAAKARWDEHYRRGHRAAAATAAIAEYEAAQTIDQWFAELHFRLGWCRLKLNQYVDARQEFVRARDLDTLRFRADTEINGIIRRVGAGGEAAGVYFVDTEKARDDAAQVPDGIAGSALLYEHVHLNFRGNYAVARAMFRKVREVLPLADRDVARKTEPPSMERCMELLPFTPFDRFADTDMMARITSEPPFPKEQGARDKAEAERLGAELTAPALARMAEVYARRLADCPGDLLTRISFAKLALFRREYGEAIAQCRTVLKRYPYGDCGYILAKALLGQDRITEAIAQFHTVLSETPYNNDVRWDLAGVLLKAGQGDPAIAEYRKVLAMRPTHALSHAVVGQMLLRDANRPAEAERYFAAAIRIDPKVAEVHFHLGAALIRQGKTAQAVAAFRRATELKPDSALMHYQLAMICHQLGRMDEARRSYLRAVELDPAFARPPYDLGEKLK